eukprot:10562841-Alexandrium_andersonii.AAC.1
MSASLVGSEMCIRDRLLHSCLLGRTFSRFWVALGVLPGPLAPVGLSGPVSYTHLTLPTICSV